MICKICNKEYAATTYNTTDCCDNCNELEIEITMVGFELKMILDKVNRNLGKMTRCQVKKIIKKMENSARELRRKVCF